MQNLNNETLIYDLTTNQAFCLNETSAKVFNACDGEMAFDELKSKYQLTDEIIYFALDGLKEENLIEFDYVSPFAGMNRRDVIRKVGLASLIVLPVISSIIAPPAISAASVCTSGTEGGDQLGSQGLGDNCTCASVRGAGFGLCNTSRGGFDSNSIPASGCKPGCICRSSSTNCSGGVCFGICG